MDSRRNFLKKVGLGSLAVLPFSLATGPVEVSQSRKDFEERSKYLDYTKHDFKLCRIVLVDHKGNRIWGPPISKVTLTKNPLRCEMFMENNSPPHNLTLKGMQFVDRQQRMLFGVCDFSQPITCRNGDILRITYHLNLD